jgi:hypothetical protein
MNKFHFAVPTSRSNARGHDKIAQPVKKGLRRKVATANTFDKALTDLELIEIRE